MHIVLTYNVMKKKFNSSHEEHLNGWTANWYFGFYTQTNSEKNPKDLTDQEIICQWEPLITWYSAESRLVVSAGQSR